MRGRCVIGDVMGGSPRPLLLLLLLGAAAPLAAKPPAPAGEGQVPAPSSPPSPPGAPMGAGGGHPGVPAPPPRALLEATPREQLGDGQPPPRRRRRHGSHFPLCSFCCNCCRNRGCGFCCRT